MARKPKKTTIPPLDVAVDPGIALIGVKGAPAGLSVVRSAAKEAWAYHKLAPYPAYGSYRNWKTEDLGPLPRCMSHPAIPSVRTVTGMPSRCSSQAVRRAPWKNGRVSSA